MEETTKASIKDMKDQSLDKVLNSFKSLEVKEAGGDILKRLGDEVGKYNSSDDKARQALSDSVAAAIKAKSDVEVLAIRAQLPAASPNGGLQQSANLRSPASEVSNEQRFQQPGGGNSMNTGFGNVPPRQGLVPQHSRTKVLASPVYNLPRGISLE